MGVSVDFRGIFMAPATDLRNKAPETPVDTFKQHRNPAGLSQRYLPQMPGRDNAP